MKVITNTSIVFCLWTGLLYFSNWAGAEFVVSFEGFSVDDRGSPRFGITCPNNRTKCTERQTCCKTKHNSYHCCRYANAVCCPDKFHCCPHGSTCDNERKRCNRRIENIHVGIEMVKEPIADAPVVEQTEKIKDSDQVCPNNRTKCKESQTCCVTKHGSYHCCKFENAVCCSDKFHCCPQDSTCDTKRHRCVKSNNEMLKLFPLDSLIGTEQMDDDLNTTGLTKIERDQTCPNNKTKCKDTKTCCITKHGNYYCCPHKNAVCCSDKYQCCPEATTCDLENKKCVSSSFSDTEPVNNSPPYNLSPIGVGHIFVPWEKVGRNCPNHNYKCPGQKNCCVMDGGQFGCCKFNKGVCCPDLKTCCPHGTECDGKNNVCTSNSISLIPIVLQTNKSEHRLQIMICPDNVTECFTWETCCAVGDNAYGCCSHRNATCCADKETCCRHDEKCDLKNKVCVPIEVPPPVSTIERESLILFYEIIGLPIICITNDTCPSNHTCCPMGMGRSACCPYSSGVCCSDLKSCCPVGTICGIDGCEKI